MLSAMMVAMNEPTTTAYQYINQNKAGQVREAAVNLKCYSYKRPTNVMVPTPASSYALPPSYLPPTPSYSLLLPSYSPPTPLLLPPTPLLLSPTPLLLPSYSLLPPTPLLLPSYSPPTPLLLPSYSPPTPRQGVLLLSYTNKVKDIMPQGNIDIRTVVEQMADEGTMVQEQTCQHLSLWAECDVFFYHSMYSAKCCHSFFTWCVKNIPW